MLYTRTSAIVASQPPPGMLVILRLTPDPDASPEVATSPFHLAYTQGSRTFSPLEPLRSMSKRVLIVKPGPEGHDRGASSSACALRDAGMEAIYKDAAAAGLSVLSGARNAIVPRALELMKKEGMDDVLAVVARTTPDDNAENLKRLGVSEVFQPGASLDRIEAFFRGTIEDRAPGTVKTSADPTNILIGFCFTTCKTG